MRQNKYEYDAFISHAVEDKIPIANELCAKLERAGLKIWYSGKELGVGDSIEKTIEKGLNRSRYGIVIFSPTYLAKNWTIREFYTLLAKEINEQKVILPVLYNITLDDLKNKDLLMADRFAVNSDRGIDFVVERLVREIRKPKVAEPKVAWFSRIWFVLVLSLLANVALLVKGSLRPTAEVLQLHASFEPSDRSADNRPTLMGQMQGLLKQACTCPCSHGNETGNPHFRNTALTYYGETFKGSIDESEAGNGPRKAKIGQPARGKMTMAVVFQIEMDSPEEPELQEEMSDILETISLADEDQPFIAVSNRADAIGEAHSTCAKPRKSAD